METTTLKFKKTVLPSATLKGGISIPGIGQGTNK